MRLAAMILCALMVLSAPASAEKRLALVIGNGAYPWGPLVNPPNDARAMGKVLRDVGFEVTEFEDIDQRTMKRAIQHFGQALRAGGTDTVGLFFYSGHGVQAHEENFLLPIDAHIEGEGDLDIEAVSAQGLLREMEAAGNAVNLILLDACRSNPFKRAFRAPVGGLAQMQAPRGSLIAYATAPGDVASDGTGANSPYTGALIDVMAIPGLKVEDVFKRVRVRVLQATGDRQTPWESSSLTGDLYFAPAGSVAITATPPPSPLPVLPANDREALFWASIKDSSRSEDFEAYLQQFPQGTFVPLARNRLVAMRSQALAPAVVSPTTTASTSEFIFPDSDRRTLGDADLRGLDAERLRLARNEIYARRGRFFQDAALQRYFSRFSWYKPTTWDPPLSAIEQANIDRIKQAESHR